MHAPPTSLVFFFFEVRKRQRKSALLPNMQLAARKRTSLVKVCKVGQQVMNSIVKYNHLRYENTAVVHLHVELMWSDINIPSFNSLIFFSINCCEVYWTGNVCSENCCLHWTEPSIILTPQMTSRLLHTGRHRIRKKGKGMLCNTLQYLIQEWRHFLEDLLSSFKLMPFCKTQVIK